MTVGSLKNSPILAPAISMNLFSSPTRIFNVPSLRKPCWRVCENLFICLLLLLAMPMHAQVFQKVVRVQDPAAGKFPSGKLLLASDGFFSGTFESGLAEYLPTVSLRP